MKCFYKLLNQHQSPFRSTYVVYVSYDQLNDQIGPLSQYPPEQTTIIMIESSWKGTRRSYHKQKLAYILANSRNFALEQAKRGVHVIYRSCTTRFSVELSKVISEYDFTSIQMMEPAERELRLDIEPLVEKKIINIVPHEGWLSTTQDLLATRQYPPWRMDSFYQRLRKKTGILMKNGKPIGGKYSFDKDNRKPWKGKPTVPSLPQFEVDSIKEEVAQTILQYFSNHPGKLDIKTVPASKEEAQRLWDWAKKTCLYNFGPFEDAMSSKSSSLFHTKISPLLNIHRLLPKDVIYDVEKLEIPFNSKEGFIRQVLGWREFMYHVHCVTDGFRRIPTKDGLVRYEVVNWGDYVLDGGSLINELQAEMPLPAAFWGKRSGLFCLDHCVQKVLDDGYTHHIPRLMILANIATLLGIKPREITDWFWVAFIDAFEWVVEPNVLAMGTFATGEVLSTKPYISGANYINKMSDFCRSCQFDPKKNCPITSLYWSFLEKHKERFAHNFRMKMILKTLQRRSQPQKKHDIAVTDWLQLQLQQGVAVTASKRPSLQHETE